MPKHRQRPQRIGSRGQRSVQIFYRSTCTGLFLSSCCFNGKRSDFPSFGLGVCHGFIREYRSGRFVALRDGRQTFLHLRGHAPELASAGKNIPMKEKVKNPW
jgi:hypothetical protein